MPDYTAISSDSMAGAVMEAFQTLRYDRAVEALHAGSQARIDRIRSLLVPIAAEHNLTAEDLALSLAKVLPWR